MSNDKNRKEQLMLLMLRGVLGKGICSAELNDRRHLIKQWPWKPRWRQRNQKKTSISLQLPKEGKIVDTGYYPKRTCFTLHCLGGHRLRDPIIQEMIKKKYVIIDRFPYSTGFGANYTLSRTVALITDIGIEFLLPHCTIGEKKNLKKLL